ncbi:hypothetical protein M8J76_002245 [Diaphorina citri]|nr:hypothetical protein M8J76_002245 [Diaphorina citri]
MSFVWSPRPPSFESNFGPTFRRYTSLHSLAKSTTLVADFELYRQADALCNARPVTCSTYQNLADHSMIVNITEASRILLGDTGIDLVTLGHPHLIQKLHINYQ